MSSEPRPPGSRANGAHVPSAPPAAPPAPPAPPPMPTHLTNPELDVAKLQSLPAEQQDLFMLQFVTDLSRHVESLAPDDCTSQQFYLKKQIFQIINLAAPQPSTPVRNDLARCLAHIFSRGDRKLLFETINDLVSIVAAPHHKSRSEADKTRTRHAAVCCLGAVFAAAGDSAVGLHQLACATLLRLLRSSGSHAGLRAAVFTALARIVQMVRSGMDDTILRDIWKQARAHAATDKAHLVVVSACRCLVSLLSHTGCFANVADFESLKSTMFKLVDSASVRVRHATAECLAVAMTAGPTSGGRPDPAAAAPKLKKPKSKRSSTQPAAASAQAQDSPDDREVPSRSQSPAPAAAAVSAAAAVVVAGGKKSTELVLSFADMLRILSTQYVKPSTTSRGRAALAVCYGKLLRRLGEAVLEANYLVMVENLTVDLLAQPTIANNRYRLLTSRRIVDTILQDVANKRILAEAGQTAAARSLIASVLKNYPHALPDRPEPTKHMLIASLGALASLIRALGSAANSFADAGRDGLLQALQHPSYSVQVSTASCVKTLVLACPQQLLPCLSVCMNGLARELSHLGTAGRNSARRCVGFAHALAAALSASPARPLHGSLEVNSRVLTMATSLLKSSGQSDLRVATTQIQVAWILIGGLMSLGPNFVKIHLSQLLLLWKNALPKPLAKDNTATRTYLEASFLAHVRECALGSILAFVQFNSRLLTVDVSKRIAAMLHHTSLFLRTLPARKTTDDITQRLTPALQLYDLDMMVQRRVLQCYVKLVNLSPAGGSEALLQSNLLTLALPAFCDPENSYGPASVGTSIANAAQTFETIWEVADNSGFGLTGLVAGFAVRSLPGQQQRRQHDGSHPSDLSGPEDQIDRLLLSPVCGSLEHDASLLYVGPADPAAPPDPAPTEVVNLAIQLFAFVFPLTPAKVQESVLEQIKTYSSAGSLQRDPGRRAAMTVNLATAVLSTLRVAVRETRSAPGHVASPPVEALLQDMIRDFAINADPFVRSLGYSALALLCSICGAGFTNHEIKHLVDTIVVNREPSARAGCAMALGAIQTKVGGMSAGYHLKTILAILMSLCTDPHPTVHYWALEALSLAADAAGLGFSAHVPGTLAMLAQLYASDTHNPEVGSAISSNLELDFCTTTTAAITRCVDSLVNVLGPDLQESTRSRHLILTMVRQLQRDDDGAVQRAALVCLEHLSLYAPGFVNFADYVRMLQRYLCSESPALRDIAVDGLHNMMKRDPQQVLDAAERGLEEQLWLVLDADPAHDGVRNIIRNWLRETCLAETAAWLQRLQRVFKMTRPRQKRKDRSLLLLRGARPRTAMPDLQDEEVAGFAVAAAGDAKDEDDHDRGAESAAAESATTAATVGAATAGSGSGSASAAASSDPDAEPLRWQVTTFAAECLYDMFTLVGKDAAANGESRAQTALQNKVGDVVRLAFSASTSGVPELRVWGLKIIGAVLKMFGRTADPDFEEAMLLEQYQAQIGSALTPAFAVDSSPELAAEAIRVCAGFVATGIVTDVDRMGRILKTLAGALESFSRDGENAGIGDLVGLSANAQVMVKMAIFAAWAELQVASSEQVYLLDVLRPHIGTLTPLWLDSLREFARLRFEPDISMTLGPPSLSGSLDTVYAALNRETLLRFYQDSWLRLVDAIASLIGQDSEFVFDALDGGGGKESDEGRRPGLTPAAATVATATAAKKSTTEPGHASSSPGINYRDEPVAFFFVLFGLAFEALATRPGHGADDPLTSQEQTLAILRALKKILHPSVSGLAIYRDAIFSETMDLLDRLVLTDGLDTQAVVVDIARALCIGHPSAHRRQQIGAVGGASASAPEVEPEAEAEADLSDDIEQLFELTRIIVLVLSGLLPNLTTGEGGGGGGDRPTAPQYPHHLHHMNEEAILLIRNALDALVDAAEVFPSVIRTDLHACIIHIFSTILATPACQEIVVPQALPTLKRFVSSMTATAGRRRSRGEEDTATTVQLRGCLRRFLSIYLEGQKRETSLSLTCVKNCLLASTLLFTGAGRSNNRLPATDSLVARYLDEVLDCLTDRMTAKIAANCIRSLLIQQRSDEPTPADLTIARYLLPRLIAFVTNTEPEDPERARALVAHTLTRYAAVVVPRDRAAVAVSTILPALMARAASEGGDEVYRETSARLLEMAAADQVAFRATVAAMSEGQRAFLEEVIRSGRQDGGGGEGDADADGASSDRPTIELKMDFGG